MKLTNAIAAALLLSACAAPQYTVLQSNATANSTANNATGPTSWPDVGAVEASGEQSNDIAVIVAIEDYAFLPDVTGAVDNANAWENYFRKQRGFKEVYTLTNKKAPVEEIKRFTEQAVAEAPEGSSLWFVFIGHGAALKDGTDGALIGMDAQQTIESIGSRSIARKDLLTMLEKGEQAQTVVVLDTCFSGRDSGGELLAQGTQPVIPVDAKPQIESGTVVLSAAGNDEVAGQLPGAERPAFSYLLLGAMRGWADDGDGNVTADEAVAWTRQQLRHVSGRQQTPGANGDDGLVLASNAAEADPGIADLMKGGGTAAAPPTQPAGDGAMEGGTLIDTNKGLIFEKPEEWGIGPAGMGVILNLAHQFSGNRISVTRMKMKQAHAGSWLSTASVQEVAASNDDIELDMIRKPETRIYGTTKGQEMEYKLIDNDPDFPDQKHVIRFGTWANGFGYVFELTLVDVHSRDGDYEDFQEFLTKVQLR